MGTGPSAERSHGTFTIRRRGRSFRIDFGSRIVLLVLLILVVSQLLGTFLTMLSFEKVYLRAVTAKYEILGKDLKRKIEQSLRFGKTLDRFVGMDRLAQPLFVRLADLDEVFLSDREGRAFYRLTRAQGARLIRGTEDGAATADADNLGTSGGQAPVAVESIHWDGDRSADLLTDGTRYFVVLAITPRQGTGGLLGLGFDAGVVEEAKKSVVTESLVTWLVMTLLTTILLGVSIQVLVVIPLNRRTRDLQAHFESGEVRTPEPGEMPDEIHEVNLSIADFVVRAQEAEKELDAVLARELARRGPASAESVLLREMQSVSSRRGTA